MGIPKHINPETLSLGNPNPRVIRTILGRPSPALPIKIIIIIIIIIRFCFSGLKCCQSPLNANGIRAPFWEPLHVILPLEDTFWLPSLCTKMLISLRNLFLY